MEERRRPRARPGNWNTTQGDHFRRTEVRQVAGSHNWIAAARSSTRCAAAGRTPSRRTATPTRRRAPTSWRPTGLVGLPGAPADRRLPALRVRGRLVHLDRRRRSRSTSSRASCRAATRSTWLRRPPHAQGRRRHPVRRVPRSDLVLRRRGARAATCSTARSPATRSPTSCSACRASPATSCRRPDVNPFSTYYAFFAQDDVAADAHADDQPRAALRPAAADEGSQQSARQLRPRLSRAAASSCRTRPGWRWCPTSCATRCRTRRSSRPTRPGLPTTLRRTDKNNISPRLGIAWRPSDDGRTVIRGGFGLYTVPLLGSVNYSMVATVTAAAVAFANSPAQPVRRSRTSRRPRRPKARCRRARSTSAAPTRSTCAIRGRRSGA